MQNDRAKAMHDGDVFHSPHRALLLIEIVAITSNGCSWIDSTYALFEGTGDP